MKKLAFTLFTCTLLSFCYGQEKDSINTVKEAYLKQPYFAEGKTIYIRIFETENSFRNSHILISYGEGKTETIELNNMKESKSSVNTTRIHYVLAKFLSKGYVILDSTSSASQSGRLTTYFLTKKV